MNADSLETSDFNVRPGIKCLHRFRSNVVAMTKFNNRIVVALANGKAYRSNLKLTRWYRIS